MTRPELIRRLEFETMLLTRRILDYDSRRGDRDLDRSGYLVLSRIRIQGPMSIGELSAAFALDRSTLHRQTAALSKCGLAERIPDPDGGSPANFESPRVVRAYWITNVRASSRPCAMFSSTGVPRTSIAWPRICTNSTAVSND